MFIYIYNNITGEKYLGSWNNGMKHGCGLIVTLDGIYYEGVFMQDVLTVIINFNICLVYKKDFF